MFLLILPQNLQKVVVHVSLHSTMFLLIHTPNKLTHGHRQSFTFHNVSINTYRPGEHSDRACWTLHSTMFLLILLCKYSLSSSIISLHSTMFLLIRVVVHRMYFFCFDFTFHNVSINTFERRGGYGNDRLLYIPQCFY